MFVIEEESGTDTGPVRRHNGYCAGDFSRSPMRTAGELAALAKLRLPTFPSKRRNGGVVDGQACGWSR